MTLHDLVRLNRSYRRFHEEHEIPPGTLRELVDLARLSASARNLQPLKFMLSSDRARNAAIFEELAWAGYLKEWPGPEPGERPSAYILVLGDTALATEFSVDPGIAMQSILLGAAERGLGGCMIGNLRRERLQQKLGLPERYRILDVVALGKPKETVVIEPLAEGGDIKYWRDAEGVHHVPKRSLDELIVEPA